MTILQHWPQFLVLFVVALTFADDCLHARELREVDPVRSLIGWSLFLLTLYVGGFFAALGWGYWG